MLLNFFFPREEMRGWARDGRWRGNPILTTQFVPSGDSRFRWANDGCEDPNASAGWSGDVDAGNPYPRVSIAFLLWLRFFSTNTLRGLNDLESLLLAEASAVLSD